MSLAIDIHALTFAYGNNPPLFQGIDLNVACQEMLAISGPSGCGKSTLLKVIAGEYAAGGGEIQVLGQNLRQMSDAQRRAFRLTKIGMVFQEHGLIDYLSARENILLPLRLTRGLTRSGQNYADDLLEKLGLAEKRNQNPQELSFGERQRVAFARALIHKPALLLADEPTTGQDQARSDQIIQLLIELCQETQTTLVFITHDQRLFHHFHRVYDLKNGGL